MRLRTSTIIAALIVVGLRLTRRVYGPGLAAGQDLPYHIARNEFAFRQLFGHGHLDGWSPIFNGGSQQFLIYGPGLAIMSAIARVFTIGQVADDTLLSAIAALAVVATAPAMYSLARALHLSRVGSAVVGALSLAVSVPFGVGLSGTFVNGLVSHQVTVPFFGLSMTGLVHVVDSASRRWMLLTAASVAVVVVTHPLSVPVLAAAALILLALGSVRIRPTEPLLLRLGIAAWIAFGLSAWWWAPLLENHGPRPGLATWGSPGFGRRLHDMVTGQDWTHPAVAAAATIALAVVLVRLVSRAHGERWLGNWAWSIALTGPLLMGALQVLHNRLGGDLGVSIASRGLGYIGLLCLLPVGAVTDLVTRGPANLGDSPLDRLPVGHLALLALACLPALLGTVPAAADARKAHEPARALSAAATTLGREMTPRDRFVWVDEPDFYATFGDIDPDMWLVMKTGRASLNGLGGNSVTPINTYLPTSLAQTDPSLITPLMDRAGVTFMLMKPVTAERLVKPADWRVVSKVDNLTIVRRTKPGPLSVPAAGSDVELAVKRWSNEAIDWRVERGSGPAILSIPAFRKWSVRIDGRVQPALQRDGYLSVDVPRGAHVVAARYHRSLMDRLGIVMSLFTAGAVIWWLGPAAVWDRLSRALRRRMRGSVRRPSPRGWRQS